MLTVNSDEYYMDQAIKQAKVAALKGEIPVGAVVVCQNKIIARAHNQTELLKDVTAHAEIIAVTAAANFLGSKYLNECTLYVTLEPCVMCAGAAHWAQLGRVVYGAADDKRGFMRFGKKILHPKTKIEYGVKEEECSQLLKTFFAGKR
jgi:tRNA(adenine34) deaminase